MLANTSYHDVGTLDDDGLLNLAWCRDEREFLDVDLAGILREALRAERHDLAAIGTYLVQDPYGEHALGDTVRAFFGVAGTVTAGAGVTSLLHALAGLVGDRPCQVVGDVYPDLPHWVGQFRGTCVGADGPLARHWELLRAVRPGLVLLDRPSVSHPELDDLDAVRSLVADATDAIVLIDESNANYRPPEYSATHLLEEIDGLVVLRGLSKAYGLGSLRIGFAMTSGATAAVRGVVPPMLPSTLSLTIARLVLEQGDVTGGLRSRIRAVRAEIAADDAAADLLDAAWRGGDDPSPRSDVHDPYLLFADPGVAASFTRRGIVGKYQLLWSGRGGTTVRRYRLALPLRADRVARFRQLLAGVGSSPAASNASNVAGSSSAPTER
jgi:histidinol-phosphate/aromatic aminotransferase/cobyric acid decarboxylase-like protein